MICGRTEQSEKVEAVKEWFSLQCNSRWFPWSEKVLFTLIISAAAARLYPCSVLSFTIGTWDTIKDLQDFWLWPWAMLYFEGFPRFGEEFLWILKDFLDLGKNAFAFWRIFKIWGDFRPAGKPGAYRFYWNFLIFLILRDFGEARPKACPVRGPVIFRQILVKNAVDLEKGSAKWVRPSGTTSK